MACHHGDYDPQTVEAVLVTAADALSAARPGARREVLETYVKRLEKLEEIASGFKGVQKTFAIQAGREVRIIVDSGKIGDEQALWLSKDIARKIEQELTYPGQIKVTVIRETRSVEYAGRAAMKLLFVGDVIGKPGRRALQHLLPRLVDRHRADYVVVNVENSAGGFGVTPDVLRGDRRAADRRATRPATTSGTRRRASSCSTASRGSCAPPTTRRATPAAGSTSGRRRPASRWR